jgi:hypothetical protein
MPRLSSPLLALCTHMSNSREMMQYFQKIDLSLVERAWNNKYSIRFHYLVQQGLHHITSLEKKPCCLKKLTFALKDSDGNEIGYLLGRLIMEQLNKAEILGSLVTQRNAQGRIESGKFVFKDRSNCPAKM